MSATLEYQIQYSSVADTLATVSDMCLLVLPPSHFYLRRPVLVVRDLDCLCGPVSRVTELPTPIRLFWSGASPEAGRYNLDQVAERQSMYTTVLREARSASDLIAFLDRDSLISLWPAVSRRLPGSVRAAWEEQHPELADP